MSLYVYKSSAGSGKTFTLVKEYLKIVLSEPDKFRNILAITFTNKAANEMKERIISYLEELSINNSDSNTIKYLLPDLIKETGLEHIIISQRAEKVLELILHNYSDFAISTIDSFVHKIIRTFARDLHIPLNFEVELDTDDLISKSTDLLISNVGNDEKLTKTLIRFIETKTDNEQSWHIENDIQQFAKSLLNEDGYIYIEKLRKLSLDDFSGINRKINEVIKKFENNLKDIAISANNLIKEKNIPHSAFYQGRSGINKYFEYIVNNRFDKLEPNSHVNKTIEEDKWYGGKADYTEKQAIDSIKTNLIECFHNIQDILAEHYEQYIVFKLLNRNIYPIAVLNEIEKVINEIKAQNNIVHISEFNKKIADIVLNEPVPFIYERLGEKYKYFLIDEFQDTSVLQWQNLLPLIDNSLAENNFNMIVGDGKQAIYRWRNGEVEQLAKLPEIFKKNDNPFINEREQNLIRNYKSKNLNSNYRSEAEIVNFNNKFFSEIVNIIPETYRTIYDNQKQEFDVENKGGMVQIEFIDKNITEIPYDELNFIKIKETIEDLVRDNFFWKDIAILCRNNKNASKIARYLLMNEIDVISSESLLLSSSPEVNFIVAMIRFIFDPSDDISKTE
ncbi:MAG: UvrD-helicase domain-containing protein, partial [Bacteroidales bacterium]|nr:UvrD-helicase domain-containing protein [Bacteroidales bacterium]